MASTPTSKEEIDRGGSAGVVVEPSDVRECLSRILANGEFAASDKLRRFLEHVVEETLAGLKDRIKQFALAHTIFRRGEDFDPQTDPVVRIHASRGRRALDHYYATAGRADPVRISMPKGGYRADFAAQSGVPDTTSTAVSSRNDEPVADVAVLPFDATATDSEHAYLAIGLGEEVSHALCHHSTLRVIASNSGRAAMQRHGDAAHAGRVLGAAFVVGGTVRGAGRRVRINVFLTRSEDAIQLWSERFDEPLTADDMFALIDRVVRRVVGAVASQHGVVASQILNDMLEKPTDSLSTFEALLHWRHYSCELTPLAYGRARAALERAVHTDPGCGPAWAYLAFVYADAVLLGMAEIPDAVAKARRCAAMAERTAHGGVESHLAAAVLHMLVRDPVALAEAARTIISEEGADAAYSTLASFMLGVAGHTVEARKVLDRCRSLNPFRPPYAEVVDYLHCMREGRFDDALEAAHRFDTPGFAWTPLLHAAAFVGLERMAEANAAYAELLSLDPTFPETGRGTVRRMIIDDGLAEQLWELVSAAAPRRTPTSERTLCAPCAPATRSGR